MPPDVFVAELLVDVPDIVVDNPIGNLYFLGLKLYFGISLCGLHNLEVLVGWLLKFVLVI